MHTIHICTTNYFVTPTNFPTCYMGKPFVEKRVGISRCSILLSIELLSYYIPAKPI